MLTLPTGFQDELEGIHGGLRATVVYELELAAGTLRYGAQAVTWGGNDYTQLAVRQAPIVEEMGRRVPETWVEFSNVEHTLRPHVEPVDLITGRRLVVRLLVWTPSGLSADSLVLHKGVMERPKRVDETTFRITSVGLLRGKFSQTPVRPITRRCTVAAFGDGVDCGYVQTTTTSGAYSGGGGTTTITVVDASKFVDELARLPTGGTFLVDVGANLALTCTAAVTGGPETITVNTEVSGAGSEAVAFTKCDRRWRACQAREREHEFQGFRGEQFFIEEQVTPGGTSGAAVTRPGPTLTLARPQFGTIFTPVPIILGRRVVRGIVHETKVFAWESAGATKSDVHQATSYIIAEGPIDSVVDWWSSKERQADINLDLAGETYRTLGIYYRAGDLGLVGDEDMAAYRASAVRLRPQKRDTVLSLSQNTLSRTAWLAFVSPVTVPDGWEQADEFDTKGSLIQDYLASNPATPDGAAAWSANPILQAIHLALVDRYGAGRVVESTDYDMATTIPEADVCDAVRANGTTAIVSNYVKNEATLSAAAFYNYTVDDVSDFEVGMAVLYNGTNYTDDPDTIVAVFPQSQVIQLTKDRPLWVAGDTISNDTVLPTYECHLEIETGTDVDKAISRVLDTCRGFTTYDAEGRIQHRVERAITDSGIHFKDAGAAVGYGIKRNSFAWVLEGRDEKRQTNLVIAKYVTHKNANVIVQAPDYDDIAENGVRAIELNLTGVNNRWQAERLAELELGRLRTFGTGATFTVGPAGLQLQPGDRIKVTHAVPGWVNESKRVRRIDRIGLGDPDDLMVRIEVEDYVASVYDDVAPVPEETSPDGNLPTIALTAESETAGKVALTWVFEGTATASIIGFNIYKSTSSMGEAWEVSTINKVGFVPANGFVPGGSYSYQALGSELDNTVYFKVAAVLTGGSGLIVSNEVTAVPVIADPTDTQYAPGVNTLFDGGFIQDAWNEQQPSPSSVRPDTDAIGVGADGALTDPGNAYDASGDSTESITTLTASEGSGIDYMSKFYFASGTTEETGHWECRVRGAHSGDIGTASVTLWYSDDGGTTWFQFASNIENIGALTTVNSPTFTAAHNETVVLMRVHRGAIGQVTGVLADLHWVSTGSSTPQATTGNGQATLVGDDTAADSAIYRPWPGQLGGPVVLPEDSEWVFQFWARFQTKPASPTQSLRMRVWHIEGTTFLDNSKGGPGDQGQLKVLCTDIEETWRRFAVRWVCPSTVTGTFLIYLITFAPSADGPIYVRRLSVMEGPAIYAFNYHADEVGAVQTFPEGAVGALSPKGPWSKVPLQDSGEAGSAYRIAEVTLL